VGTSPPAVSKDKDTERVKGAAPQITGAKRVNTDKLEITGTELVNTKDCGGSEP
jgi:hypothetical protein